MTTKNEGGWAFPFEHGGEGALTGFSEGITLRQVYAAMAMLGKIMSDPHAPVYFLTEHAFRQADAMLRFEATERQEQDQPQWTQMNVNRKGEGKNGKGDPSAGSG
jgi:hypothetical protein